MLLFRTMGLVSYEIVPTKHSSAKIIFFADESDQECDETNRFCALASGLFQSSKMLQQKSITTLAESISLMSNSN
jgi:hypothetical protein